MALRSAFGRFFLVVLSLFPLCRAVKCKHRDLWVCIDHHGEHPVACVYLLEVCFLEAKPVFAECVALATLMVGITHMNYIEVEVEQAAHDATVATLTNVLDRLGQKEGAIRKKDKDDEVAQSSQVGKVPSLSQDAARERDARVQHTDFQIFEVAQSSQVGEVPSLSHVAAREKDARVQHTDLELLTTEWELPEEAVECTDVLY